MRPIQTKNLAKAIVKTVDLTRLGCAKVARICTPQWVERLQAMNLHQTIREFRKILRLLSLRFIGRTFNHGAFNSSDLAVQIAAEIIMERGNRDAFHVRALMDAYDGMNDSQESIVSANNNNANVVIEDIRDVVAEPMFVDPPVDRRQLVVDYDAIEAYVEDPSPPPASPPPPPPPAEVLNDNEIIEEPVAANSSDSGFGSLSEGQVFVVHAMVHRADEPAEHPESPEVIANVRDPALSNASTEINEEQIDASLSQQSSNSRKFLAIFKNII